MCAAAPITLSPRHLSSRHSFVCEACVFLGAAAPITLLSRHLSFCHSFMYVASEWFHYLTLSAPLNLSSPPPPRPLSHSCVYLQRHHGGLLLLRAVPVPHTAPRPGPRSRHSSTAQRDLDDGDSGLIAISLGCAFDGSRCFRGSLGGGVCGPGYGEASGVGSTAKLPAASHLHQVRGRGETVGREEALQAQQRGGPKGFPAPPHTSPHYPHSHNPTL